MCGILGVWHMDGKKVDVRQLENASRTIRHRGPDDEGFWCSDSKTGKWREGRTQHFPEANLAFAFRRLAILDLSSAGHQPMHTPDGVYCIVFNGEVYNYLELKTELQAKGYQFRSNTDTEIVLAAYSEWGSGCLKRFNGMWAFALWDANRHQLFCARDRFGIKPFYYYWDGTCFAFASEIKALATPVGMHLTPYLPSVFDYLAYGLTDHGRETFYENVYQILPAHFLLIDEQHLQEQRYWDLDPNHYITEPNDDALAHHFYNLFEDAVRLHLRSDVAVGTCLSGGLDSSAIVTVANKLLIEEQVIPSSLVGEQQKTFSACFDEPAIDERVYMQAVLDKTGAEKNFVFPSLTKLQKDLNRLMWHQEQPFGGTSIFAQWCVIERAAASGVRVLLDGQGGDELLGGYDSHRDFYLGTLAQKSRWSQLLHELHAYRHEYYMSWSSLMLSILRGFAPEQVMNWARLRRRSGVSTQLGISTEFRAKFHDRLNIRSSWGGNLYNTWAYHAITRAILPALLRYEDRNSMAHSVEARVPFLDYRLVEFTFALPLQHKIRNATSKIVLRDALRGVLPEIVRTRKSKLGYTTPERAWFDNALGTLLQELLYTPSFRSRGYFDIRTIESALEEHRANQRDLSGVAWRWINLELWSRQMIDKNPLY